MTAAAPETSPDAWHALTGSQALERLGSRESGLSEEEARTRLRRFGPNALPTARPPGLLHVFLRQFGSPLIYLLLAAAVLSAVIGDISDAGFIFAVLLVNAAVGSAQEWKAQSSAEALKRVIALRASVRRAGGREEVPSEQLVPGDIVHLESGARVPADIRLVSSHELLVDEALLTGESVGVLKDAGAALGIDTPLAERRTMVHAGTTVMSGRGEGVVVATGLATQVGLIAEALIFERPTPPPLVGRLAQLTRAIGIIVMLSVLLIGVAELARGDSLVQVVMMAIALAVAAIPEGLPVAITVALAIATARMARRGVIVRLLPAVEGLGACTMIASDKTGTLTCNELTVRRVVLPGGDAIAVTGEGYVPEGTLVMPDGTAPPEPFLAAARRLATAATLCNEATLRTDDDRIVHFGDTVDVAFLVLAGKLGIDRGGLLDASPEVGLIPFESERRFAVSFNSFNGGVHANVKGAAESVVPMCAGLDGAAVLEQARRLAESGYRVLAVAAGPVAADAPRTAEALTGLEFLGLVGLIDPVRPEVPDAIRRCRSAGVMVTMVTGDHPATALAISRELGIADSTDEVVTGADLVRLRDDPARFAATVERARIFARVEPAQKTAIVEAMVAAGHYVAVTGDGVNDAPALHAAHIGVAMGRSGTDVARSTADLILTDDNFAAIVSGIEEGRTAYANVRKVTYLLVSTGAAEIVLFVLAIACNLPMPLFAVQLLWLNLVTNGIQDVALAFERGAPDILDRPPRPPSQPIFDRLMIEESILSGTVMGLVGFGFFAGCLAAGWTENAARNALLLLMVLFENFHIFNCRSELRSVFRVPLRSNPFVVVAAFAAQGLHIAAMNLPGLSDVLRIGPVPLETYILVFGIAFSLVLVMEVYKLLRPRFVTAGRAG